jgi:integrase
MRVCGASHGLNSGQNDERGKTEKKGGCIAGGTGDGARKHLTGREVERLIEATKGRRHEVRDRCLLILMFRHGLRVSEAAC